MDWSRAKNLLILLMVCINLYLGLNIWLQLDSARSEEVGAVLDACSLLEKQGITVDKEALLELPAAIGGFTFSRSIDSEHQAARRLMGDCEPEAVGGGIYTYRTEAGQLTFRSGGYIELQLQDGEKSIETLLSGVSEERRLMPVETEDGYCLTMDGREVVGAAVSRTADGLWTGSWIFTYALQDGSESLSRAQLILSAGQSLRERELHKLDRAECIYVLHAQPNGELSLTPAWRLTADAMTWYISALTGLEMTTV